jgi:hypothetical protein
MSYYRNSVKPNCETDNVCSTAPYNLYCTHVARPIFFFMSFHDRIIHKEGHFGLIQLVYPRHFLLTCCTKPEKWEIMYMCACGIDLPYVYMIFRLDLGTILTVWYFSFSLDIQLIIIINFTRSMWNSLNVDIRNTSTIFRLNIRLMTKYAYPYSAFFTFNGIENYNILHTYLWYKSIPLNYDLFRYTIINLFQLWFLVWESIYHFFLWLCTVFSNQTYNEKKTILLEQFQNQI